MCTKNPFNLYIASYFQSFNGECTALHQGSLCTFIRFAGCNLSCKYCDTKYSQKVGADTLLATPVGLLKAVFSLPLKTHRVTITGGEPLLQRRGVEILVELLNALKIPVSIETNGTYPIPKSWDVASWVIDCKLLGSGTPPAVATKHCEDWVRLTKNDFIKFVVTDRKDFEMAHSLINDLTRDGCVANLALSAASASPEKHIQLLKWMQDANLTNTILNVQIHKLLFPNSGGGKDTEV